MERVKLNVGGVRYETTRTTLTQCAGSYFSAMFSGLHPAEEDADGSVFIDRDGDLFRHVLAYLRTGSVSLPRCRNDANAVLAELEYFGLHVPARDSIPDFTRQELQGLRASGARHFAGARLAGVDLSKLSFDEVVLDRSDLRGACLADSSLNGASCRASDFQHADLRGADFRRADLSNADLRNARIDTMLPSAIDGGNLAGLDLRGGVFPWIVERDHQDPKATIVVRGADFRGADLSGVDLRLRDAGGCAPWGFIDCNFDGANLSGVRFVGIHHLKGCTFNGANLTDAIIHGTTQSVQSQHHRFPDWRVPGSVDFQAAAMLTRASIKPVSDS